MKNALISATVYLAFSEPNMALAQTVRFDFDKDGRPETVSILGPDDDARIGLSIDRPGLGRVVSRNIAYHGSSEPISLSVSRAGSLLLKTDVYVSSYPWEQTLTIAYRQGAYRVIGWTYSAYAKQEDVEPMLCDINLSTGQANIKRGNRPTRSFRVSPARIDIRNWSADRNLPPQCDMFRR
jgi:hypothetical protein